MLAFVVMIVAYVLGSLGFYTIASRRGIKYAWLAWVPIGNAWLLGCISDQYQSVALGKEKRKRTWLLILNSLFTVCLVALVVLFITLCVQIFLIAGDEIANEMTNYENQEIYTEPNYEDLFGDEMPEELVNTTLQVSTVSLLVSLLSVPMMIVHYFALYDLFRSCDPGSCVMYLLLSIFLGISQFLVFACKEKDYGMPRKETPPPFYTPYQPPYGSPGGVSYGAPGSNPYGAPGGISYGQPPQPPQPEQEPWEKETE